jgi:ABC-type glycerol-3-phosphate transport system substrate-binding protein
MARNPDVTIDVRALPSDIQWDRVARTTVSAGEQVDLLNINGLFIRSWVRDNLLDDLSTHSQLTASFGNVDQSFLAAQSDDPRHPFAVPVIHASPVHVTALFYNKALLDKAGLQPPRTLADSATGRTGYRGCRRISVGVRVERLLRSTHRDSQAELVYRPTGHRQFLELLHDR